MNTTVGAVLVSVLVSVGVSSVRAEEPVASLKTTLVTASLFKNGLGYMAREAALPKGNAGALIEGLPAAVHGTLWVYTRGDGATVTDLVAFERDSAQPMPALSVAEVFRALSDSVWEDVPNGDKPPHYASSIIRRNMQREYVHRLSMLILGTIRDD